MKMICPECENESDVTIYKEKETYDIKKRKIEVDAEYYICSQCGADFATPEQMEATLQKGFKLYRTQEKIVSPEEIIRIREKYGASQKAFAKILDMGELTINNLENGALATKSISNLIQLMDKPDNFSDLFQKNRHKLSPFQIKKIQNKLNESKEPLYSCDLDKMVEVGEKYTGYGRPDWEKYVQLLQMILITADIRLYKMALLKIAFYIDFTAYKNNAKSITGWPYAAINFGPVPEDWKDILHNAEDCNNLLSEPDLYETGELFYVPENIDREKIKKVFTNNELKIINKVTQFLKNKTATELRDLTHEEDAWKLTDHARKIDYRYAEKLKLF